MKKIMSIALLSMFLSAGFASVVVESTSAQSEIAGKDKDKKEKKKKCCKKGEDKKCCSKDKAKSCEKGKEGEKSVEETAE